MIERITADAPLLGPFGAIPPQCYHYILSRPHGAYSDLDVAKIIGGYFEFCGRTGISAVIAISQLIHETGNLTSALSQREDPDGNPCRNPAGIGVNGERSATPQPGFVYDADRGCYRRCCGFTSWRDEAIPAHIGRLLAYALKPGAGTDLQKLLIRRALSVRLLPQSYRGSAPTLRGLEGRWAVPGHGYADKIAAIANAIRSV